MLYQLSKTILYTKAKKCEFYSNSIEYLRYILFLSKLTIISDQNNSRMAQTKKDQEYTSISRIYQLLLVLYASFTTTQI